MISANLFTWPDFFLCQSKSNGARAQDVVKLTGEFLKKTSKIVADSYNFLCLKTQLYICVTYSKTVLLIGLFFTKILTLFCGR